MEEQNKARWLRDEIGRDKLKKEPLWKKKNIWIPLALILVIIILSFILFYNPNPKSGVCSDVRVYPSWAQGDFIFDEGFKDFVNGSIVDFFIRDRIQFIYHSECNACESQIALFGNKWEDYKQSGLVVDCS
jgi:hypothetical protein